MRSQLLASLTSKLVAGVAATTLAAGSAGAMAMTTISDETVPVTCDVATEEVVEGAEECVDGDGLDAEDGTTDDGTGTEDDGAVDDVVEDGTTDEGADGEESGDEEGADDETDADETDADGEDTDEEKSGDEVVPVDNGAAIQCAADAAPEAGYANFGQHVSALRACGFVGGMSELAHEKNAARKAAKAPVEESEDEGTDEEESTDTSDEDAVEDGDESTDDTEEEETEEEDTGDVSAESTTAPGSHGKGHAKKNK